VYSQFFLAPTCDIEVAHTEAAPILEATDTQQLASDTTRTKSGMQDAGMGAEQRKEHKAGFAQTLRKARSRNGAKERKLRATST